MVRGEGREGSADGASHATWQVAAIPEQPFALSTRLDIVASEAAKLSGHEDQRHIGRLTTMTSQVHHKTLDVEGVPIFYREAGPPGAPVVLLPHGYPCSSYQFRNYMAALGDHWRLLAPDFPGSGYSGTPPRFDYSFDGFATLLESFLHRPGSRSLRDLPARFRIPDRATAGNQAPTAHRGHHCPERRNHEDTLGPKYAGLKAYFRNPTAGEKAKLDAAISEQGFKDEFLNELPQRLADRIPPDLWTLHWSLMTEDRRRIALDVIAGLRENLAWFPRYQAYLRREPAARVDYVGSP